jgi:lipid-A-disaccharide synthase
MGKKIFLIAGEPSGDSLGAALIRGLRAESTQPLEFVGIGGPLMAAEGLDSLLPMDELCVMGLWEVIGHLPRLMGLIRAVTEEIEKHDPDVVVTIDLPDFNFHVAKRLKKRAVSAAKIVHYVAPSVWAWRPGRAKKIAAFLDGLMCLFPFEPPYFQPHGLKTGFVGHPLVEMGTEDADGAEFRRVHHIAPDAQVLGLFFGSRAGELKKMASVLEETALILQEHNPDLVVVVPTLKHLEFALHKMTGRWRFPAVVVTNPDYKWSAFSACDAALAVSGTVGLELAYMNVPHAIAYKMHPLTWQVVKRLIKVKYAHLCNILLDRPVVPEYLQAQCESIGIARGLLKLAMDEDAKAAQIKAFAEMRPLLRDGETLPSRKAAAFVLAQVGS